MSTLKALGSKKSIQVPRGRAAHWRPRRLRAPLSDHEKQSSSRRRLDDSTITPPIPPAKSGRAKRGRRDSPTPTNPAATTSHGQAVSRANTARRARPRAQRDFSCVRHQALAKVNAKANRAERPANAKSSSA